jgi:hypothetical protein
VFGKTRQPSSSGAGASGSGPGGLAVARSRDGQGGLPARDESDMMASAIVKALAHAHPEKGEKVGGRPYWLARVIMPLGETSCDITVPGKLVFLISHLRA